MLICDSFVRSSWHVLRSSGLWDPIKARAWGGKQESHPKKNHVISFPVISMKQLSENTVCGKVQNDNTFFWSKWAAMDGLIFLQNWSEQRGSSFVGGLEHQQNGGFFLENSEATYLAGLPLSGQWCSTMAFLAPRSSAELVGWEKMIIFSW